MSPSSPNAAPPSPAGEPSRALLESSLERVAGRLREAAERYAKHPAGDPLHDLRVALRRATAAAALFQGFPRKGDGKGLRRRARNLRRLLSAARQQEVSAELIRGLTAPRLAAILATAMPGSPPPDPAEIAQRARDIADGFARWRTRAGRSRLLEGRPLWRRLTRRAARRRRKVLSAGLPKRSTLHAQRVAGKALRYQLELLEAVEPAAPKLLAASRRFQEALGTAHDHACLEADVTAALASLSTVRRGQAEALLPILAARRRETLREARDEARRFLRVLSRTRLKVGPKA